MKRKLLIALLCAAAMYCLAWTGLADRWDGDWLLYANSGSTAVIKDYRGSAEAVEVPRQVTYGSSRLTVVGIAENVFVRKTSIRTVILPDSVTSIGNNAFDSCTGLTSVTIPGSVTSIGAYAFNQCANLKDIYYVGEQAQWQAVEKGASWNEGCSAGLKVHCLFTITTDGAALAYYYNDRFEQVFPTQAAEGTALSLMLSDSAELKEPTHYFTGEFWYVATGTNDEPVSLGSITADGWTSPVTDFTMRDYDVTIGAVQARRETLALAFAPGETRTLPMDAWMQLQYYETAEGEPPLIWYDEATGTEALDVDRDGLPDLRIAHDDAAYCVNLTRLADCATVGEFAFSFSGPTDHYSTITFTLPVPAFGTPDFTLPAALTAVEEEAFEGIAASVVDVPESCVSIGAHAFRNCANLAQIRLPADCAIDETAFAGCGIVQVFAPAGGDVEAFCAGHDGLAFVAEE